MSWKISDCLCGGLTSGVFKEDLIVQSKPQFRHACQSYLHLYRPNYLTLQDLPCLTHLHTHEEEANYQRRAATHKPQWEEEYERENELTFSR